MDELRYEVSMINHKMKEFMLNVQVYAFIYVKRNGVYWEGNGFLSLKVN